MKRFMCNIRCLFFVMFGLVGCGGGGGGGGTPPTPVSVTVTCPNGTSQVATTAVLANAACPTPILVSINPTGGSITVSPDTFIGVQVVTDSLLDVGSLTTLNIKLMVGSLTTIASTVVIAPDGKGFTLVPAAKLSYGPLHDFTATVKDTLGRTLVIASSFTTAIPTCTLPAVWTSGVNACVTPTGVQVLTANQLPAGCNAQASQCWNDSVVNGTVKFIAAPVTVTGDNSRPVVFAYFRNTTSIFGVNGLWNFLPIYADDGSLAGSDISGGSAQEIDYVKSDLTGVFAHTIGSIACLQYSWDTVTRTWLSATVACPP